MNFLRHWQLILQRIIEGYCLLKNAHDINHLLRNSRVSTKPKTSPRTIYKELHFSSRNYLVWQQLVTYYLIQTTLELNHITKTINELAKWMNMNEWMWTITDCMWTISHELDTKSFVGKTVCYDQAW